MSYRNRILARLTGKSDSGPLFLPDLTLWHKWHTSRGTLPAGYGASLASAVQAMRLPGWVQVKPWQTQYTGATWTTHEAGSERTVRFETERGTLTARWTRGPDGDWWQTEYPVKTAEDMRLALEVAKARVYVLDDAGLSEARQVTGANGVVALELPMRPYSDALHTMVGWGEGLSLMLTERALADEIIAVLEQKLHELTAAVTALPGDVLLAPDNLDGQYISPRTFKSYLAESYSRSAEIARRSRRPLVVHVGGPARKLVALLAEAGVDAIEGIAGPPQSDVTLAEARAIAGSTVTLWGGLSQDHLTAEWDEAAFERALELAAKEAKADARAILGVADRVPVNALLHRLARSAEVMEEK
jgi:hypothetical protein